MIALPTKLDAVASDQLGDGVAEVESGSRFVQHSTIAQTGVAIDRKSRGPAFGSTTRIRDTGETVWDSTDPKCRGRFRTDPICAAVPYAVSNAKPKLVDS